jgi:hypothetical protein
MAGTRAVSGLVTPHLSGCQPQTRQSATVRPMGLLVQSPLGHQNPVRSPQNGHRLNMSAGYSNTLAASPCGLALRSIPGAAVTAQPIAPVSKGQLDCRLARTGGR